MSPYSILSSKKGILRSSDHGYSQRFEKWDTPSTNYKGNDEMHTETNWDTPKFCRKKWDTPPRGIRVYRDVHNHDLKFRVFLYLWVELKCPTNKFGRKASLKTTSH